MLSFRAVFNNQNNNCIWDEWDEIDLTWYDNPSDGPYEFEYIDEENNTFITWTKHLIRFHDWILECYSKGYTLFKLTVNINNGHDQTQEEILFSMTHFCKDYSDSMNLIIKSLRNYCGLSERDLKFTNYILANLQLSNRNIILINEVFNYLKDDSVPELNKDEVEQLKEQAKSLLKFPFSLHGKNELKEKEIVEKSVDQVQEFLKYYNLLLIKKGSKSITGDAFF